MMNLMNKFGIVNLEGLGIKAKVVNVGETYTTYKSFAVAAGHPDAAVNDIFGDYEEEKRRRVRETFGEIVDVLVKGNHEQTGELIYVVKAKSGEKFLIGERGLKITKRFVDLHDLHDMEYCDLIEHVEKSIRALRLRAYREGYKQGRFDEKIKGSGSEQYQQQRRDEIVERAKRDIDELRDDDGLYEVFSAADLSYACFVDFIVNREKRTVVALLRGFQSGKVLARGIAKCHPDDCFNAYLGKAIALRRALGLEVPDEYLNAPQPTEVRVGDVVETYIHGYPERYVVVKTDKEVEEKEGRCHIESITANYFPVKTKVIDDSREEVAETE